MISGKAFSDLCTWIYDPRYRERPFMHYGSRNGDWVFINGEHLDQFLRIRLTTPKRFNLIIHNADEPFDGARLARTLPRALHIWAINTTVKHPQLTTIPLGFPDSGLKHVPNIRPSADRHIEIYSNFSMATHKERGECFRAFENDPRVVRKNPVNGTGHAEYYDDMCHSKFVLCPRGVGEDTHRVYEALACGATPVLLHSNLDHLYAKLPVCILNQWTDPLYVPDGKTRLDVHFFLN
jgi:hypothetical protein